MSSSKLKPPGNRLLSEGVALVVFRAECTAKCGRETSIAVAKGFGSESSFLAGKALTVRGWVCLGARGSTEWICPVCWARRLTVRQSESDMLKAEQDMKLAAQIEVIGKVAA